MTSKSQNSPCPACGKKRKLTTIDNITLCSTCHSVVDHMKTDEKYFEKLSRLSGREPDSPQGHGSDPELPEELNAIRYRTTDRERNTWYVSVSELDGAPVEIFASTAFDRDQHLQSRISNLTTITRLISLILRHVFMGERLTLEKTLTQLRRSSRQKNDLPDMLSRVLSNYSKCEHQ
ncbi:TSCPD domain-containing protein [Desulfomarina sp.]